MKKIFLLTACLIACLGLNAQDTKVAIASATASSYQNGEEASMAIDGNLSTFWHSQWGSGAVFNSVESVEFTITLKEVSLVDYVRYIPRQNSNQGHWGEVEVSYSSSLSGGSFTSVGTFNLGKMGLASDLSLNGARQCGQIKFTIRSGNNNHATAAEIEAYKINNDKGEVFAKYFDDPLYTTLKSGIDINNITDADVKALVASLQNGATAYKEFRVGEYEPYMTLASVQKRLGTVSQYSRYENPTGIYFSNDDTYWVAVSGIENSPVYLTVKNWVENEDCRSYPLRNGLNCIKSDTEGNVFVSNYTDDVEAENVEVHFINAPVLGYWDKETMTNDGWKALLNGKSKDDNTILMVQSEHVQLAYPISAWLAYCPEKVSELMELYEKVQWAERDILGLKLFNKEVKNRQLYYATTYGFMAATNEGGYCNVNSLKAIMTPDVDVFDSWGVGHEWGHNNQIVGFHWSGCGEATNNIYASWAQLHFKENPSYLRLEDEVMVGGKFLMRGGRMQAYFEEALLNKIPWQLHESQDNYNATPEEVTVMGQDADGKNTVNVTTTKRNYDHLVKLVPFWQLNLWGTMAKKSENIIPKVIESIRTTENYTTTYNTNGKQQINWMKLACDESGLNLLPFFEKAGMLRPINAYIEDYAAGWNIITEAMINQLKDYIKEAGYETPEEEINYINGHNYHMYLNGLELEVPNNLNEGCSRVLGEELIQVNHKEVKNAVAFETYNIKGELIRITMYGLGSDDTHSFTQVLFPVDAAYIMAVGYDGTRKTIYHNAPIEITTDENNPIYYTIYNTRSSQPGGLIYYAGDEVGLKDSPATLSIEDKYQFYFTGSHDAMYIHNKATAKKLASVESWTGEGVEWAIGFSPMGNGWAIGPKGGLDGNACINEKNFETEETVSDFTTWSANDAGSVFILEKVENLVFPESDKFYVIECPLFYNKQGVRKGLYVDGEGNLGWNTIDVMHKNYYWKLVENNGVVSLQNVGTGTYLNGDAMSETATNTTINYLGSNNYNIVANSVTVHANGHGGGSNASGSIVSYGGVIGTASAWTFVEKQNPDEAQKVTVKYIFKYNGTEVATQDVQTLMGEEYPNFTLPYGVVATTKKPEGVVETDGTTVNVEIAYSLSFVPANDFNSIQNWYYAQMHAYPGYGFYIFANDGKLVWNGSADANAHKVTATGDNLKDYLWGFVGNAWDGFKMVNKAGKAVCSTGDGDVTVGDLENATAFIVTNSQAKGEWFCLKNKDTDKYLNLDYYNATIQHWNANDNGSSVFLTEYGKTYDIAVLSTGYASYYSQYRLEIPETVEAYVVSEIDDECAILEQVTGILPENTGVILMGRGIHSFKTSAAAPASIENNELKGTAVDTEVSGDAYILANGESGIGLYKVELSNGKFTNNANKAYLPIVVEDGAEAPVLRLTTRGDDATGIQDAELTIDNGQLTIYDLTGRRVEKMEKGIYIVNGRKVVIK